MNGYKPDSINQQDFDNLLQNSIAELPPSESVVRKITPFRKAFGYVLWGMALGTITLDFLCLDYFLPTAGILLTLLGLRSLRRENPFFRTSWMLSIANMGCTFSKLILLATIWQESIRRQNAYTILSCCCAAFLLAMILCLRKGFSLIQEKAGLQKDVNGFMMLFIWYLLVFILGILGFSITITTAIPIIILYSLVMYRLYCLSLKLQAAGYAVHAAPIRIADRVFICGLSVCLVLGVAAGYRFGSQYPMEWAAAPGQTQPGQENIRSHLLTLGFPESILADLSDVDIAQCEGALQIVVSQKEHPVNGRRVIKSIWDITHYQFQACETPELRITSIAVEIPGNGEQWKIFHHFEWITAPGFHGTDAIRIWPAYTMGWWTGINDITGQILYDEDNQTFISPYYSLERTAHLPDRFNDFLYGTQGDEDIVAAFSFPEGKERYRGYISYEISEHENGNIIDSYINYIHQRSPLQYPVQTAADFAESSSGRIFSVVKDFMVLKLYGEEPELWNSQ